jgi:hypothetical protein
MINKKLYIRLCNILDRILIETGCRQICINCPRQCCDDCKYISDVGCTTKSITCKLWLCFELDNKISGDIFDKIYKIAQKHNWIKFRFGIDDYK